MSVEHSYAERNYLPPSSGEDRSLSSILASICARAEAMVPGAIAGFTICNLARTHFKYAIFPSLPQTFSGAIRDVAIESPFFGSCVQAVSTGEIVTCPDIAADKRFDRNWAELCTAHGIRSLQSRPIYLRDGAPFGSFVLCFREPRAETDWNVALIKFAADAAGEAIQAELERSS
jgi:GAF domain-containing protein